MARGAKGRLNVIRDGYGRESCPGAGAPGFCYPLQFVFKPVFESFFTPAVGFFLPGYRALMLQDTHRYHVKVPDSAFQTGGVIFTHPGASSRELFNAITRTA